LLPLRTQLLSSARADDRTVWASSAQYLTVGKRDVETGEIRRRVGRVLQQVTEHLSGLYAAYIEALECIERDDMAGGVSSLLLAGVLEEAAGRMDHARSWFSSALTLAEGLSDRRPEIETLLSSVARPSPWARTRRRHGTTSEPSCSRNRCTTTRRR